MAAHSGQKFCLRLRRAQVTEGGVFTLSVVEDFDVVEDVCEDLWRVGEDMITHRGGFVAAEGRFLRTACGHDSSLHVVRADRREPSGNRRGSELDARLVRLPV